MTVMGGIVHTLFAILRILFLLMVGSILGFILGRGLHTLINPPGPR